LGKKNSLINNGAINDLDILLIELPKIPSLRKDDSQEIKKNGSYLQEVKSQNLRKEEFDKKNKEEELKTIEVNKKLEVEEKQRKDLEIKKKG